MQEVQSVSLWVTWKMLVLWIVGLFKAGARYRLDGKLDRALADVNKCKVIHVGRSQSMYTVNNTALRNTNEIPKTLLWMYWAKGGLLPCCTTLCSEHWKYGVFSDTSLLEWRISIKLQLLLQCAANHNLWHSSAAGNDPGSFQAKLHLGSSAWKVDHLLCTALAVEGE